MAGAAGVLKQRFESVLGGPLEWQARPAPELVATGVPEVDLATGGLPRGCLTEIYGPASSGRTTLLHSILAEATRRQETCALVDAEDAFDPASAAASGVRLERLLWVRCAHSAEQALRAADLLIQGGGFGLVAMDMADTPPEAARRISLTSWFRLRRAVENTPAVLLAVARQSNAKTCASLMLECARQAEHWPALDAVGPVANLRAGCQPAQGSRETIEIAQSKSLAPPDQPSACHGGAGNSEPSAKFSLAGRKRIAQGVSPGNAALAAEPRQGRKNALTPLPGLDGTCRSSQGSRPGLLSFAPDGAWTGGDAEYCKLPDSACLAREAGLISRSRAASPPHARLLGAVRVQSTRRKPGRVIETRFHARALE
jgi:recombination protein RecA